MLDSHGDPTPWTYDSLELACETAGKPVDRRTIQNWKSGKNKPGRRNMHVLAKVASQQDEHLRRAWADAFIATLESPPPTPQTMTPTQEAPSSVNPSKLAAEPSHQIPRRGAILAALFAGVFIICAAIILLRPSTASSIRIAVMPIEDISPDTSRSYLSAGITDDIIHSLTQLPGLYVTPRRDSKSFERGTMSVSEIGERLDVNYILDGIIQRDGERLKLNTVLINTKTGKHVWANQFDHQTNDIFKVQRTVAEGVTGALNIYMSPEHRARMFDFGTENVEAYRQYIRGRYLMKHWHETHEGDDIWRAGEALEAAVDADPTMARAWVHMTDLYYHYAAGHIEPPTARINVTVPDTRAETAALIRQVLQNGETGPDQTAAYQARANRIFFSKNWSDLRDAALTYADDVTPKRGELEWLYTPIMLVLLGETEAQERLMYDRVLKYDPGNATAHAYVIRQYLTAGNYDLAEATLTKIDAGSFTGRLAEVQGYILQARGDGAALLNHVKDSENLLTPLLQDYFSAIGSHLTGDIEAANEILATSQPLKDERIHLALAKNHMGQRHDASRLLNTISREPIGSMQIAVLLSYGAACGPTVLPPIDELDGLMKQAGIETLPCIGKVNE